MYDYVADEVVHRYKNSSCVISGSAANNRSVPVQNYDFWGILFVNYFSLFSVKTGHAAMSTESGCLE